VAHDVVINSVLLQRKPEHSFEFDVVAASKADHTISNYTTS